MESVGAHALGQADFEYLGSHEYRAGQHVVAGIMRHGRDLGTRLCASLAMPERGSLL